MKKLNDDNHFKNVNYYATDLTKTFARIRKQMAEQKAQQEKDATEAKSKTTQLRRKA